MFKNYTIRFVIKASIVLALLTIYVFDKTLLDYENNALTIPLVIYWLVLMLDFIFQMFPNSFTFLGVQRQFEKYYQPEEEILESNKLSQKLKKMNSRALIVLIVWILGNVVLLGIMKLIGLFSAPIMILLSSLYYFGDLVCVLIWCPFQSFFIKCKCCHDCRIYSYGNLMMVTPLFMFLNEYSIPLILIAFIIVVIWEVNFYKHPERFLEETNRNLRCINCSEHMCKLKRKHKFLRSKK